jgi:bifunctional non-homologous end joining protein LigD
MPTASKLHFVVHKHNASHLHYDFRLEMDGVLKSWAVPKGPSLDPSDKRLAVMVGDHALSYRTFEGIIPEGNYGAGQVDIWDMGTYEPVSASQDAEKNLIDQLGKGHLNFIVYGDRLKGQFSLIKSNNLEENGWLLIKKRDRYAVAVR